MRASQEVEADHVRKSTAQRVNRGIDQRAASQVRRSMRKTDAELDARVVELGGEWDLERYLEVNASALALTGLALGAFRDRRWLALPGVVLGFLLQHAVQGWCPPVEIFRRLGIRTRKEIDRELYAVKAARGDFEGVAKRGGRLAAHAAWAAADPEKLNTPEYVDLAADASERVSAVRHHR